LCIPIHNQQSSYQGEEELDPKFYFDARPPFSLLCISFNPG